MPNTLCYIYTGKCVDISDTESLTTASPQPALVARATHTRASRHSPMHVTCPDQSPYNCKLPTCSSCKGNTYQSLQTFTNACHLPRSKPYLTLNALTTHIRACIHSSIHVACPDQVEWMISQKNRTSWALSSAAAMRDSAASFAARVERSRASTAVASCAVAMTSASSRPLSASAAAAISL